MIFVRSSKPASTNTPIFSRFAGSPGVISRTCFGVTRRTLSAKINPTASAPASAASKESSSDVFAQIFTHMAQPSLLPASSALAMPRQDQPAASATHPPETHQSPPRAASPHAPQYGCRSLLPEPHPQADAPAAAGKSPGSPRTCSDSDCSRHTHRSPDCALALTLPLYAPHTEHPAQADG